MHIRLRKVPLKIWEFEPPRRRIATTHITFHKTKISLAADSKQTTTKDSKKGFYEALVAPEISRQQSFLRAHIFFLYHAVTKKNWSPYLSCPPETLVKIARNNVNTNISKAKTNYFKRYFETNLGDINLNSWKGVNSMLGRNLPTKFTTGPRLADNISKTSVCFEDYIPLSDSSFTPRVTHCGVVHRSVSSLQLDKATGLDGTVQVTTKRTTQTRNWRNGRISSDEGTRLRWIASAPARLLKDACPEIVPSLTHIINLSIRCGYFPDEWKISKVSPSLEAQGMATWWERSPPTNVALVQIPAFTPYVGSVCCSFSPLLREVFLRELRFSPLLKNHHFQIRPEIR